MRKFLKSLLALSIMSAPLSAGALRLEVGDPATSREALARNAVVVAWTTACHSPGKTTLTATAEGVVNGMRRSIPLKVIPLSAPGTFAVTREWPSGGTWEIKMVATNPDYTNYATSAIVPMRNNEAQLEAATRYSHAPSETELSMSLN